MAVAQTKAPKNEVVKWSYHTKKYNLEIKLIFAENKLNLFSLSSYRMIRGTVNECDSFVERGKGETTWKDEDKRTFITGNDGDRDIDITVERRDNGFYITANICNNVGTPNVLLIKKGDKYVGKIFWGKP
jgi:hypothetical protein